MDSARAARLLVWLVQNSDGDATMAAYLLLLWTGQLTGLDPSPPTDNLARAFHWVASYHGQQSWQDTHEKTAHLRHTDMPPATAQKFNNLLQLVLPLADKGFVTAAIYILSIFGTRKWIANQDGYNHFRWGESPQGVEFWSRIHLEWEKNNVEKVREE